MQEFHKISSSLLTWSLDTSRSERPKIFNHCILHGIGIPKISTTEKALSITQNPFPLIKLFSHFHRELLNQPCKSSRPHRQFSKSTLSTKVNAAHVVYAKQTPVLLWAVYLIIMSFKAVIFKVIEVLLLIHAILAFLGNAWQASDRMLSSLENSNCWKVLSHIKLQSDFTGCLPDPLPCADLETPWSESLLLPVASWWQLGTFSLFSLASLPCSFKVSCSHHSRPFPLVVSCLYKRSDY